MNDSVRAYVEDSAALRERIVGDIAALGRFDIVGWAESQNEAVESIALLAPDVVVTDLRLKEGSGVEVLRRVREKRPMPPPSIVVLTNYATLEYKQRCFDFGADEFFDKTSEYDEFLQRMRAVAPQFATRALAGRWSRPLARNQTIRAPKRCHPGSMHVLNNGDDLTAVSPAR